MGEAGPAGAMGPAGATGPGRGRPGGIRRTDRRDGSGWRSRTGGIADQRRADRRERRERLAQQGRREQRERLAQWDRRDRRTCGRHGPSGDSR